MGSSAGKTWQGARQNSTDEFLEIVRKSIGIKELISEILHELIDYIVLHHAENLKGERVQKIEIYYNCIGLFEAPKMDELPERRSAWIRENE